MKRVLYGNSPWGRLAIGEEDGRIARLVLGAAGELPGFEPGGSPLLERAAAQLAEYFAGERLAFDLPLTLSGTDFQRAVQRALLGIPAGETRSYQDIAVSLGRPLACRAVGLANKHNPIAVLVPCHRVIGKDGRLSGYAAGGPEVKAGLLALERRARERLHNAPA